MFHVAPHEVEVGYAGVEIGVAQVVGGVEFELSCASLFGDDVCHLAVGEFNGEDDRDLLFSYERDELGDGRGACLGFGGAAGEGGEIGEAVFVGEVAEGETVAKYDGMADGLVYHFLEGRV